MVLPFARSGARAGNALAGTVAGMVTNQNTPRPISASATTSANSLRIGSPRLDQPDVSIPQKRKGGASNGRPSAASQKASAFLDAVGLVAAAAVLGQPAERGLEAVGVLHRCLRGGRFGLQFGEQIAEAALILPDLRRRGRVAAGFGVLREQC